jgi:hypothetical protein
MPGQAVGGPVGAAESMFSHLPIVGQPVKAALEGTREQVATTLAKQADELATAVAGEKGGPDFVRGVVNKPLAVIGETSNPDALTGNAMVEDMKMKLSAAFNEAVPTAGGVFNADAKAALADARANAKLNGVSGKELETFDNFVQTRIMDKIDPNTGTLSGPEFQAIDRYLGNAAHKFLTKGDVYQGLGHAYYDLQGKMRQWPRKRQP